MRSLARLPALLLPLAAAACSGTSGAPPAVDFPMTVRSASGSLQIVLDATPNPLAVGTDSIELSVTRVTDGKPVEGLDVAVVPWMPAMDHGTSNPTVTAEGGGKYLVSNLYFYMPGTWELKTTFSGPETDHAEPQFQVQ